MARARRATAEHAGLADADEAGVVLIFVVIMLAVLLGMLALVVDVGNARQQRRQAQVAADAAALSAVEVIETYGPGFDGLARAVDVGDPAGQGLREAELRRRGVGLGGLHGRVEAHVHARHRQHEPVHLRRLLDVAGAAPR